MPLRNVTIGWKALNRIINRIIDTVNANEPLEGAGIRIIEHQNGKLIELSDTGTTSSPDRNQQQSAISDPHQLIYTITESGVKWQQVTVVDPGTCAQSTITVLTFTGNPNDIISTDLNPP